MNIPPDYDAIIESSYYKIGLRGMPFIWVIDCWQQSTRDVDDVKRHIKIFNAGLSD